MLCLNNNATVSIINTMPNMEPGSKLDEHPHHVEALCQGEDNCDVDKTWLHVGRDQ